MPWKPSHRRDAITPRHGFMPRMAQPESFHRVGNGSYV